MRGNNTKCMLGGVKTSHFRETDCYIVKLEMPHPLEISLLNIGESSLLFKSQQHKAYTDPEMHTMTRFKPYCARDFFHLFL